MSPFFTGNSRSIETFYTISMYHNVILVFILYFYVILCFLLSSIVHYTCNTLFSDVILVGGRYGNHFRSEGSELSRGR